ncbi:MAG: helix-turn-helix domain-containing protein [Psychrobium sp.]
MGNLNVRTLPSAEEIALAQIGSQELSAMLEANGEVQNFNVVGKDGSSHEVKLPTSAVKLMIEVLTQLGQGNSVNITPIHAELTTQEAADMLNMSRPSFIKLLDAGNIPHSRTGNRRKVAFMDVMNYKQVLDNKRLETLEELSALDQELGLGY